MRDLGEIDLSKVPDCTDRRNWSARDIALGSTGRRMSDPEYKSYVMLRGVFTPRGLADDGARLLTRKERAVFEHVLACARERGKTLLCDHELPAAIRAMPGETPDNTGVNLGLSEPRWKMFLPSGELIGGMVEPSQAQVSKPRPQHIDVDHGVVVHHHHHAPVNVEHGQPAYQRVTVEAGRERVLASFRKASR